MSALDMLKADMNILVMVFSAAVTLPFKVSSSKHSFCPTSGDVTSLSFAPLLPLCAMNSESGKKNKQTETKLICVCAFLPKVNNFKTDKSRCHCKYNVVVINNNNPYLVHTPHTLATHAERFTITFWKGKKLIKRFKLQHKVKKNHKRYSS